ncbi:MAG TPA: MlaD family protein [Gemmatimonadaceae bacterium]|jgi:phospholipid/cholesterol/gamma-HCH transport system substrate-binding protein|nr:MlaD family protein [Gemmatimonadaceae bacterium]
MKRRNEVSVGILITVAVIVLVLGTLWLARGKLKAGYPLYTRFAWGQNLKQGQPVLLAGVSVGYVGDVNLRRNGFLDVMLRIDDQYTIPKGSTAAVKPVGIFGDVAVALTPPPNVPDASYAPGDTVAPGPASADIGQIMSRVDTIGVTLSVLMHSLQQQIVEAGTLKDINRTVASTAALSVQLQKVLAEQNQNLTQTMESFRSAAGHLSNIADSAQIDAAIKNLRQTSENGARLVANLDSTNTEIRKLVALAQNGNGTVGKLLTDTTLYNDTHRLLRQLDSLVADIKANPKKYINVRIF